MKTVKKSLKIFGRFCAVIVILLVVYVASAFLLSRITVNSDVEQKSDVTIFIKTNGVHTDLIVPVKTEVKDWTKDIRYDHTVAKDSTAKYLAVGWGDRDFYLNTPTWADLKASTAFNAAFYLGTSIMHTEFYNNVGESLTCRKIQISEASYRRLVGYIENSFYKDQDQRLVWIPNSSYGKHDAFYEGNNKYSLFTTCNTWANAGLKAAGQKAALWTVTDTGIFCHYAIK